MSDFFSFVENTTKDSFQKAQSSVFQNEAFDAYSRDLDKLTDFIDNGNLKEAVEFDTINTILSPRAHLYKAYCYKKLEDERGENGERFLAIKIMEGISLTGNGTEKEPYVVTYITDERDFLSYIEEEFASQSLLNRGGKLYDVISTLSGKEIYFDISIPYMKMKDKMDGMKENSNNSSNKNPKKWWKFWS